MPIDGRVVVDVPVGGDVVERIALELVRQRGGGIMNAYDVDRIAPHWFVFGHHADGCVDVADPDDSTLVAHIPRETADRMILAREAFRDAVRACLENVEAAQSLATAHSDDTH